jgi:hypothetical protein
MSISLVRLLETPPGAFKLKADRDACGSLCAAAGAGYNGLILGYK